VTGRVRGASGVLRTLGTVLLGAGPAACYHYVPVEPSAVPGTEEVRVRLTPAGATRMSHALGAETERLGGLVAPRGRDSLAVSIVVAQTYRGVTFDTARQALMLGSDEVADVRRRTFSRPRTTALVVGSVVGFALLVRGIVTIADPNPSADEPLPPPPPQLMGNVIAFRIPFR